MNVSSEGHRVGRIAWDDLRAAIGIVLPSPEKGARPVIRLAADSGLGRISGRYFNRLREVEPAPQATNDADAARMWELAERATA